MSGWLGEGLALLSAAAFALSNIFISRTAGSRGDKGVLFSVLVTMVFSGVLFLLIEAGRIPEGPGAMAGLGWFAAAGVSAMVFGRTFVYRSIRALGVARSSSVKRLNPFFSVILATAFLSEAPSGWDIAGMGAIALALGVLVRAGLRREAKAGTGPGIAAYGPGVIAAMAYSVSYLARKLGLQLVFAPALGTFVSALAGFAAFAALAVVWPRYRKMFTGIFANLDRWIVLASILISAGQILMFAALAYAPVSTVVMIASLEVFIAIFLSSYVFRIEARPDASILAAAALATAGAVLLAMG